MKTLYSGCLSVLVMKYVRILSEEEREGGKERGRGAGREEGKEEEKESKRKEQIL